MMQTDQDMTKDFTFRLRLDDADRERLERVAAHYSAPASTAVRILIKEKDDALKANAKVEGEALRDEHSLVLHILTDWHKANGGKPIPREDLDGADFAREIDLTGALYPDHNFHGGVARVLNDLVRWGYLRRIKGPALVVLPKALAR